MTSPSDYNIPPFFFAGPPVEHTPRREVTEAERAYVENFLAEIKGLCGKYNLTIKSFGDDGEIAITESPEPNSFAFCWEIGLITAGKVEGLRWD